jgi:hypothetical protein
MKSPRLEDRQTRPFGTSHVIGDHDVRDKDEMLGTMVTVTKTTRRPHRVNVDRTMTWVNQGHRMVQERSLGINETVRETPRRIWSWWSWMVLLEGRKQEGDEAMEIDSSNVLKLKK